MVFISSFILACTSSKQSSIDTSTSPLETETITEATDSSSEIDSSQEDSASFDSGNIEDGNETSPEPFTLSFVVVESVVGGLKLTTNLPMYFSDCENLRVSELNCSDDDQDGLTDVWEDLVIEHFRPMLWMDEDEPFSTDPNGVFAQIARIAPTNEWVDLFIVLGWSEDYGRCGISAHPGDSERVALRLVPDVETGSVSFYSVYTAAHEGEITDAGRIWSEAELTELDFIADPQSNLPRWIVYPSEGKHATYATIAHCESVSVIPCLEEDCGPDNTPDPNELLLFGPVINAGEEDYPRHDDLSVVGFPTESIWGEQDFCGGLGGQNCSSPIREKLRDNPF